MKKITVLILLGFISAAAQTKGVVKDSISGQPIPYVNIWVQGSNLGTTSDENGNFSIGASAGQRLVFSAVGFESKTVDVSKSQNIVLNQSIVKLDEVEVRRPIQDKEITIGKYNKKNINLWYACYGQPWIVAKYFKFQKAYEETPFLKSIQLTTNSYKKGTTFNLRILEANSDGSPGNTLLDENLIIKAKNKISENVIDISKYQIKMPESGIFIAYEFLIIEENKLKMSIKGQKDVIYNYLPLIGSIPCKTPQTWKYIMGNWMLVQNREAVGNTPDYEGKYTELAIMLTLTN